MDVTQSSSERKKSNRRLVGVAVKSETREQPRRKWNTYTVTLRLDAESHSCSRPVRETVCLRDRSKKMERKKWQGQGRGEIVYAGKTRQSNFCTTAFSRSCERNLCSETRGNLHTRVRHVCEKGWTLHESVRSARFLRVLPYCELFHSLV